VTAAGRVRAPVTSRLSDAARSLRSRETAAFAIVLALIFGFYLWTATSSGNPVRFGQNGGDRYNLLSDAFLDGRASLLIKPDPGLVNLPNPYDPEANAQYRAGGVVHDLSLYNGRFYMYWGPTPAATLFIPFRILPFGDMPENLAVVLFSFAGLLFSVALMRFLVRRYLPDTPTWLQLVGVAALGFVNVAPFIMRRPSVYEVAISSGYCFLFAGLYFLATGVLREKPSLWRLGAGSLSLGLATGSRYDLAVVAVALVAVVLWFLRARLRGWSRDALRLAAVAAGPLAACLLLLAAYNYARFDSLTEFGLQYQLAGVETRLKDAFNPAYLPPGLWFYILAPMRFSLAFPYLQLPPPPGYPGTLPSGYDGVEVTTGVLTGAPIVLALFAVPFFWKQWGRLRELRWIIVLLAALGLTLAVFLAFTLWGATMRYEMDFLPMLLVAALLAWFALALEVRPKLTHYRLVTIAGVVLVAFSVCVGVAISFVGYDKNLFRANSPGTYETLEDITSPLPTVVTMFMGRPAIADIDAPNGVASTQPNYVKFDVKDAGFWLDVRPATIKIVSPSDQVALLQGVVVKGPDMPRGTQATLVATSSRTDAVRRVPVTNGYLALPLDLRRGLNRVTVRLEVVRTPSGKRELLGRVVGMGALRVSEQPQQ
jgi:hypothetical protein